MQTPKLFFGVLSILALSTQAQTGNRLQGRADSIPLLKLKNEPRFTFNVHGGYGIGLESTFKFYPDDISSVRVDVVENNPSVKNTNYKSPAKGLGEGFRIGIGLSYTLNDFINVGIDVDYFNSKISKVRDSTYHETKSTNPIDYTYNERYKIAYDASLLTFSPNITFKAISRPKWFLYNKVGAVITVRPNSIQRETQDIKTSMNWQGFVKDSSASVQRKYDWGIRNPAFGFMGGIGVQFKLFQSIRAFTEVQFSHIVFQVRSRTLTDFFIDGESLVETLPVAAREIQFEKSISSSENRVDPNSPTKAIVQRFPVTYVGMQVGLAYRF